LGLLILPIDHSFFRNESELKTSFSVIPAKAGSRGDDFGEFLRDRQIYRPTAEAARRRLPQ
jgi:hypothetical protein